jgi:hypothetical protein
MGEREVLRQVGWQFIAQLTPETLDRMARELNMRLDEERGLIEYVKTAMESPLGKNLRLIRDLREAFRPLIREVEAKGARRAEIWSHELCEALEPQVTSHYRQL